MMNLHTNERIRGKSMLVLILLFSGVLHSYGSGGEPAAQQVGCSVGTLALCQVVSMSPFLRSGTAKPLALLIVHI